MQVNFFKLHIIVRKCIKCFFSISITLVLFNSNLKAQQAGLPQFYISSDSLLHSTNVPLSGNYAFNKCQWLYPPNSFRTKGLSGDPVGAGHITKLYFRIGYKPSDTAVYYNFTLKLSQNIGTKDSFANDTFITGMTPVFYDTSIVLTGADTFTWIEIPLQRTFYYNPNLSLVFEMGSTTHFAVNNGNYISVIFNYLDTKKTMNLGNFSDTKGRRANWLADLGFALLSDTIDAGVTAIGSPLNNSCGRKEVRLSVAVKNHGHYSQSRIPLEAVLSGDINLTLRDTMKINFTSGDVDTFYFSTPINTLNVNKFNIKVYTVLKDDEKPGNDTVSQTINIIQSPVPPDVTNARRCTPGIIHLSATRINGDKLKWYNSATGGASIYEGITFTTPFLTKTTVYYVAATEAHCESERIPVIAAINKYPSGSALIKGATFDGNYNAGTNTDKDNVCINGTLKYEITPPTGYTNAGYDSSWRLAEFSFTTLRGTIPASLIKTNPSVAGNGSITFVAPPFYEDTIFIIKIRVQDVITGCDSTFFRYLQVAPQPRVAFTADAEACSRKVVTFINQSKISRGNLIYKWNFGDGGTSSLINPQYTFAKPGTYTVKLKVTSATGCMDSTEQDIDIIESPLAKSTISAGCVKMPVNFTDESFTNAGNIVSRQWNFGDGNTSADKNAVHTYSVAGTYAVKLKITSSNGCTDSVTKQLLVSASPVAAFTATTVCQNEPTVFSNTSTVNSATYFWNFGDGGTSAAQNPSHVFKNSGTFKTYLLVRNPGGCIDTITKSVTVLPLPNAGFTMYNDSFRTYTFSPRGNFSQYNWNFGDGNTSTQKNPVHIYDKDGAYKVSLEVKGGNGCRNTFDSAFVLNTVGIVKAEQASFFKLQVTPNPFTSQAVISYELEKTAHVSANVYGLSGKIVAALAGHKQAPGKYSFTLNADENKMNSGMYLLRIVADDMLISKQLIRLK